MVMMKLKKKNATTGKNLIFPCSLLNNAAKLKNEPIISTAKPDTIRISKLFG